MMTDITRSLRHQLCVGFCLLGIVPMSFGQYVAEQLRPNDPQQRSRFGNSVSISDQIIAVGSPTPDLIITGAVHVFERVEGLWTETGKLTVQDDEGFGSVICVNSNFIAVPSSDLSDTNSAIYVFDPVSNGWARTAKVSVNGVDGWDRFGIDIDISGTTIAVGCPRSWWTSPPGSVYIFDCVDGVWTQTTQLVAPDAATWDHFGQSVSIDGNTLIIGGFGETDPLQTGSNNDPYGAAYVFLRDGAGTWNFDYKWIPGDAQHGSYFGHSVAVDEDADIWAASASGDNAVYVWGPGNNLIKLTGYGASFSLCDNRLAVGSAAHMFEYTNQVWSYQGSLCSLAEGLPVPFVGSSVSLSKDVTVVGRVRYNPYGEWKHHGDAYAIEHDSDSDGAGDPTELIVGSDPDNPDTDGDGSNDGHELDSGTSPTDSNDVFKVIAQGLTTDLTWLEWNAKIGKTYQVQKSFDLTNWIYAPSNSIHEIFESERTTLTNGPLLYIDPSPISEESFYRILLK